MIPAADKFVLRIQRFEGSPEYGLRLMVSPGGCSGLSASFEVAAMPAEGEALRGEQDGPRFPLPVQSRFLLLGVTMDFSETAISPGFKFLDSNKISTCGTHGHSHDAPGLQENVREH